LEGFDLLFVIYLMLARQPRCNDLYRAEIDDRRGSWRNFEP